METEPAALGYGRLSSYRRCVERISERWPGFSERRRMRMRQGLFDAPVEKVAENIVEDLLTDVLDWPLDDVNLQIGRADMVLSALGIKHVVLELKRPGSLAWHRTSVHAALNQAREYAARQHVGAVAISDGLLFYAADVINGGLRDRVLVHLDAADAPLDLWWVSVHGIYRANPVPALTLESSRAAADPTPTTTDGVLVHPKYHLPCDCFAFVGMADEPHTWKLPFRAVDGTPDSKRLPKAIQSILSNYRGARVGIPREAVGDVLVRLSLAAAAMRKLPCQCQPTAEVYVEAHQALIQLDRLKDVGCCDSR